MLAHEIAHVCRSRSTPPVQPATTYEWLDEATAEWAMDYVDPAWNTRIGC